MKVIAVCVFAALLGIALAKKGKFKGLTVRDPDDDDEFGGISCHGQSLSDFVIPKMKNFLDAQAQQDQDIANADFRFYRNQPEFGALYNVGFEVLNKKRVIAEFCADAFDNGDPAYIPFMICMSAEFKCRGKPGRRSNWKVMEIIGLEIFDP
eukprot:m.78211 g.78211  ORF g.78211 m.78211 type:complete len:152 (+) comp12525_c0_seq1:209-664(+)